MVTTEREREREREKEREREREREKIEFSSVLLALLLPRRPFPSYFLMNHF